VCGFEVVPPSPTDILTGSSRKRSDIAKCIDRRAADVSAGVVDYGCASAVDSDAALARHTAAAILRPLSHSLPSAAAPPKQAAPGDDDGDDSGAQQQQQQKQQQQHATSAAPSYVPKSVADQLRDLTSTAPRNRYGSYDLAV
jgi:hypothetical protein